MKAVFFKIFISLLLFGSFSYADRGNVGCGLGSVLFPESDGAIAQVFTFVTNHVSTNQSSGLTSGTSGCGTSTSAMYDSHTLEFVSVNMDGLAKDISVGSGESLDTLLSLLNVEDTDGFKSKLKSNFSYIFTSVDVNAKEVLDNIIKVVV